MAEPHELVAMMPFAAHLGIELTGARGGYVNGTARPLRVGRSVIVVETELRDDDGVLLAHTTQSQSVLS
jgi:acyl-coenzyme A thioesterase PaaI-like protein